MRTSTRIPALVILLLLLLVLQIHAKTVVSAVSGSWASSSTWNPMGIPSCGDSIVIQPSHTITVSNQLNYNSCTSAMKIIIYGKLKFLNGSKLSLPCGSYVMVKVGGSVSADVGLSNSNFIEICNQVEWNSNAPLIGPACIAPTHPVCSQILPVELSYFNASSCDNAICLQWKTQTERNCRHFEIQRSSDGIHFESISSITSKAANGYSFYELKYEASDNSPLKGINYYRLKQVDNDGSYVYTEILSVQKDAKSNINFVIYPNVTNGAFNAQLSGLNGAGEVVILLRNSGGEIVHKAWQHVSDASEPIHIEPLQKLPDGIYYCYFLIGDEEYNAKVVVAGIN